MTEKKKLPTQFGQSATGDFENLTWTFKMPEKFTLSAGDFAIIDKSLYDQLMQTCEDLAIHCSEHEFASIYLSNLKVTLKRLQGVS